MLKLKRNELIPVKGGITCIELALLVGNGVGLTGLIQDSDLKAQLKASGSNYGQFVNEVKDVARGCEFPPSFLETGNIPPGQPVP